MQEGSIELVTVKGILTPCNWDAEFKAVELVVHSDNEEDYFVADTPGSRPLYDCCPAVVSVTGYLSRRLGKNVLDVVSYHILEQ